MRTIAIIQARMGSQRLPGKVLEVIQGEPMLGHVIRRASLAREVDGVVVATSNLPADQPIAEYCQAHGHTCFRGSETDVLDRYYQAASHHRADAIVRITSDCPLIDSRVMDQVISRLRVSNWQVDYASNVFPKRTFPRGLDVEVIAMPALRRIWRDAQQTRFREHVTLAIVENSELFRYRSVNHERDESNHRWTVDTPEDLALVRRLSPHVDATTRWQDVLRLVNAHPEWMAINQHIQQKVA